jgi:hypothetical protein
LVGNKDELLKDKSIMRRDPSWPGDNEKHIIEYLKDHSSNNYNDKVGVKRAGSPLFHKMSEEEMYNLGLNVENNISEDENYENANQSPNGWGLFVR